MKYRNVILGLVILAGLGGYVYFRQNTLKKQENLVVPQTLSVEDVLEEKFKLQLPQDADKAELKDVTGGDASGIATKKFESGNFSQTILVDLPEPEAGKFYQGWLVKGEEGKEGFELIKSGKLILAKGGYLLDFQSRTDYSDYSKIIVTLEQKDDTTPEKRVLEGSF